MISKEEQTVIELLAGTERYLREQGSLAWDDPDLIRRAVRWRPFTDDELLTLYGLLAGTGPGMISEIRSQLTLRQEERRR